MNIRPLKYLDFDCLDRIVKTDFPDGWNKQMLLSAMDSGRFFGFVLEIDKIISFITYEVGVDGTADIQSVYTLKEYRQKGFAKTLLKNAITDCENRGMQKIFLEVRENNFSAIKLYQSFGFKQISVRKKYYSDGENAVVMLREIGEI